MFGMFPFMFNNNNNNNSNNINSFYSLLNGDFFDSIVDQVLNSDTINGLVNDMFQEDDYDIELKDYDDYYLIRGYLPGLTAKDVSIDFEKNKAILTIKKRQTYSNGNNFMMTVVQTGGNLVKNFYIGEVDVSNMRASFENDVLLLAIPKVKKIEKKEETSDGATIIDVDDYKVE